VKKYNDSQPFFVTQGGRKKKKAGKKGRVRKTENYGYTNKGMREGGVVLERTVDDGSDEMRWMSSGGWYSGD
jgi:hypothetical protein